MGLYEQASRDGINVVIFGSLNAAGVRLNGLTGIAAILRFELPQLHDMVEEDEGHLDSEEEGEMGHHEDSDSDHDSQPSHKSNPSKKSHEEETKGPQMSREFSGSQGADNFLEDVFEIYGGDDIDISLEDFDGTQKSVFK